MHEVDIKPEVEWFLTAEALRALIETARREDLGPRGLDITSEVAVKPEQTATAVMRARAKGVFCGGALLEAIAGAYDERIGVACLQRDGRCIEAGMALARWTGPLAALLAMERVSLNFACHLSGIATLTARYVAATAGTKVKITDTRKTIPGLRGLAKYAVVCGGGCSHRMGLYDAVLVKDNHLAQVPAEALEEHVRRLVDRVKGLEPKPKFVEVEVDDLTQFQRILDCGMDMVLLDNMSVTDMREAVAMRDRTAPGVLLEASGGVTLETVAAVAGTGVDRIAVGAITHSAAALDIGMDIDVERT